MNKQSLFLLVDDDADDAHLFQEVLAQVDPTIAFQLAQDGQEALDLLKAGKQLPDLVFLDLNMPRMDGKELLSHLKRDAQLRGIPVIIYTTSSHSKDIEEAIMLGAICFITKPSSVEALYSILQTITQNLHRDLGKSLRTLSDTASTYIVC